MRNIALGLSLLLLFSTACGTAQTPGTTDENQKESVTIEYAPVQTDPALTVSFGDVNVTTMNAFEDLPTEGNVLKVHDVCYDPSIGQGYAVGILTDYLGVFNESGIFKYIPLGMGGDSSQIKYVSCGGGFAFVSDEKHVVKIDGERLENVDTMSFKSSIFPQNVELLDNAGLLVIPVLGKQSSDQSKQGSDGIEMVNIASFESMGRLDLDKTTFFETKQGIYVWEYRMNDAQHYSYTLNPHTLELSEQESHDLPFLETATAYDASENTYWFIANRNKIWKYTPGEHPLEFDYELDDAKALIKVGYELVILTGNGFDQVDDGNYYGGIAMLNAENGKLVEELPLPYKHENFDFDETNGTLYLSNNDGNSFTIVDTSDWSVVEVVPVGSSVEHGVVSNDGELFASNRLGGSTIYHFNSDMTEVQMIKPDAWPVATAYNRQKDVVYAYNMLASSVTVMDGQSGEIVDRIDLGVPDGATDSLADMSFDELNQKLYVAIPEQAVILVYDIDADTVMKTIDISELVKRDDSGPGNIVMGIYEHDEALYVRSDAKETFTVFDGKNDYEMIDSFSSKSGNAFVDYPFSIFVDQYNGKLFVGDEVYDVKQMSRPEPLSHGEKVFAFDYELGIYFVAGVEGDDEVIYALNTKGEVLDQMTLRKGTSDINARYAYDQTNHRIYAFYMIDSAVWSVDFE